MLQKPGGILHGDWLIWRKLKTMGQCLQTKVFVSKLQVRPHLHHQIRERKSVVLKLAN